MISFAFLLIIVAQSASIREVIVEATALGAPCLSRLAMLDTVPLYMCFGLFFFTVLVMCLFQVLGPMQDIKNSLSK
jgi:hypothetical protein